MCREQKTSPFWGITAFFDGSRLNQMVPGRPDGCLGAVVYAQFVENVNNMTLDRMGADVEHARDFSVAGPFSQNAKDLQFPGGKGCG